MWFHPHHPPWLLGGVQCEGGDGISKISKLAGTTLFTVLYGTYMGTWYSTNNKLSLKNSTKRGNQTWQSEILPMEALTEKNQWENASPPVTPAPTTLSVSARRPVVASRCSWPNAPCLPWCRCARPAAGIWRASSAAPRSGWHGCGMLLMRFFF